jgi:capsular polysaccharide biosynthesis protein
MIDIDDVASEKLLLETCAPPTPARWIEGPRGKLGDASRNPYLAYRTRADVQVHAWRVRDVVLDADTMLLLHEGRIIRQTDYHRHGWEKDAMRVDPARLHRIETKMPVLICGDAWCTNHYHFLNHTLPAIDSALSRHGIGGVVLAERALRPAHEDMLRQLGHGARQSFRIEPGRQYAIAEAEFCAYTVGVADFANSAHIQALHGRLAASVPAAAGTGGNIYISRLADTHRRTGNEAELVQALARRGFTIISPSELTAAGQIATFRAARFVVAPHGAGLSNLAFCTPGAAYYEMMPANFTNPCFLTLAIRRGLRAWIDAFAGASEGADHTTDWALDIPAVLSRLEEIEPTPFYKRWFRQPRH